MRRARSAIMPRPAPGRGVLGDRAHARAYFPTAVRGAGNSRDYPPACRNHGASSADCRRLVPSTCLRHASIRGSSLTTSSRPGNRRPFPQQHVADHLRVPLEPGPGVSPRQAHRLVLQTQQEAIPHGVSVDLGRQCRPPLRCHPPPVPGDGGGDVQAGPAAPLRPPREVGILPIGKERLVEELALKGDVLEHRAPVQRDGAARAEDFLRARTGSVRRPVRPRHGRDGAGPASSRCPSSRGSRRRPAAAGARSPSRPPWFASSASTSVRM